MATFNTFTFFCADVIQSEVNWKLSLASDWEMASVLVKSVTVVKMMRNNNYLSPFIGSAPCNIGLCGVQMHRA